MDKRYTVFVSSTFKDLVDARWAVARALMRLNLIPLGMENFTASDKSQWEIIKKTMDLSDYYVLILGNCYGSIDPETGISYTEKEYRYALEQGIPCLTFVSKDVPLKPEHRESDKHRKKLDALRAEASAGRMVDSWTSAEELTAKVATALVMSQMETPRPGWVRNPQVSPEVAEELARLSRRNAELEREIVIRNESRKKGLELDSKDHPLELKFEIWYGKLHSRKTASESLSVYISLKEAIRIFGVDMLSELSISGIDKCISEFIINNYPDNITNIESKYNKSEEFYFGKFISKESISGLLSKLIILEIVESSIKKRSIKDKDSYWRFTDSGKELFLEVIKE